MTAPRAGFRPYRRVQLTDHSPPASQLKLGAHDAAASLMATATPHSHSNQAVVGTMTSMLSVSADTQRGQDDQDHGGEVEERGH
jgi:hypothetical protein